MKVCCCALPDLTGSTECCKHCINNTGVGSDYIVTTKGTSFEQLELPGIDWDIYKDEHGDSKVNHPSHYNQGKYEVIDVIDDWKLDFELGNAVKYIARAGHKENKEEDLNKAIWYIKRELENIKK